MDIINFHFQTWNELNNFVKFSHKAKKGNFFRIQAEEKYEKYMLALIRDVVNFKGKANVTIQHWVIFIKSVSSSKLCIKNLHKIGFIQ